MKKHLSVLSAAALSLSLLAGCASQPAPSPAGTDLSYDTDILLSDSGVTVDGAPISSDSAQPVYAANDIVFYLEGQGLTYGEGTQADEHSQAEADAHTVVHITRPGTYRVSGTLSAGQIAVDLGEDAEEDPEAVVTLLLDGMDLTCTVAPGVIFYNVYECGSTDADTASYTVDTSAAGANVVLADGSVNTVHGSYVARIYKPGSVELSEDGTEVTDSKKLHKYDGAFYSKMTMNVTGGAAGTGVLNIFAENEGLDSELHLTVNGGNLNICSGNDGINTNEDGVSVTTINGGTLNIRVTGETGEGDGIDSNGWLVINGGTVLAASCSDSGDAGIDSDLGIHINGGTVLAAGNMLDRISDSQQTFAVFQFSGRQSGGDTVCLKNESGEEVLTFRPENDYRYLIFSSPELTEGVYTLWSGETRLAYSGTAAGGMGGPGRMPGEFEGGEHPEPPEGFGKEDRPEPPEGFEKGDRPQPPEGADDPENRPEGRGDRPAPGQDLGGGSEDQNASLSTEFIITAGENTFSGITTAP